jgi:hypothetical protein
MLKNNKGQLAVTEFILIIIFMGTLAFGAYTLYRHGYNEGYAKGYAQSVKDRPTYEVRAGGKVTVEAQCKSYGFHIFKGVLGFSW